MATTYSTHEVRLRAADALRSGMKKGDIAAAYRINRSTLYRWQQRLQQDPRDGLKRKKSPGSARPRKSPELGKDAFFKLVLTPASEYGYETDLWTIPRLKAVLAGKGHALSAQTIHRRLDEHGITNQKAQRRYFDAGKERSDDEVRHEWRRKVLPEILAMRRKYRAILYFEDESHIALSPVVGRTWAPRGQTPRIATSSQRGGFSAISAISRQGHLLFQLHDHRIRTDEIIGFLGLLLSHHKRRHLVVVMDNASPHVSKRLKEYVEGQKRLHVFYFPPRTPEWNPDEQVWNHLKNHEMQSHRETTKDGVWNLAFRKLEKIASDPDLINGIFLRSDGAHLLG
jgi:transposase